MTGRRRDVFVWATGQHDNIGDSLLRRAYLDYLRTLGTLHIWVGAADAAFSSGLGVRRVDTSFCEFRAWYRAAVRAALRGRAIIAINAGEVPVSGRGALRLGWIAALLVLVRVRGGHGVWLGASVPGRHPLYVIAYRACARLITAPHWRDARAIERLGCGALMPDWAFALGTPVDDWAPLPARRMLAVSLRGDRRPPSDSWVAWVRGLARTLQLDIVVVVQVVRDVQLARLTAERLDAAIVAFPDADHLKQEARVRDIYRDCALVIGDRLHALIVAASEGAVPLGWVPSSRGKIRHHFDAVGMGWVGLLESVPAAGYPAADAQTLATWHTATRQRVSGARSAIARVEREVSRAVGVRGAGRGGDRGAGRGAARPVVEVRSPEKNVVG